jgi:hypothetical protein
VHVGKSVPTSSKSAAGSKSHDQQRSFSSPGNEKKEKVVSPKTVPQIGEFTMNFRIFNQHRMKFLLKD